MNSNTPKNHKDPSKVNITGVYKVTCTENGKVYWGSSANIHGRWVSLRKAIRKVKDPTFKGRHLVNNAMQDDIKQYGTECWKFELVHDCHGNEALAESLERIEICNTPKEQCYNWCREGSYKKRAERVKKGHRVCQCGTPILPTTYVCMECWKERYDTDPDFRERHLAYNKKAYDKAMADADERKRVNTRKNNYVKDRRKRDPAFKERVNAQARARRALKSTTPDLNEYVPSAQAQVLLSLSQRQLLDRIKKGQIKAYQVRPRSHIYVHKDEIQRYLDSQEQE